MEQTACLSAEHKARSLAPTETDDNMRAIAERVFASETKDETVRDEISMFDVPEDCPILQTEMAHHLHTDDNKEKRWACAIMWPQQ